LCACRATFERNGELMRGRTRGWLLRQRVIQHAREPAGVGGALAEQRLDRRDREREHIGSRRRWLTAPNSGAMYTGVPAAPPARTIGM
jgi:hypothetical protein